MAIATLCILALRVSNVSSRITRLSIREDLYIDKRWTELGTGNICYRGANHYNQVELETRECATNKNFKVNLKPKSPICITYCKVNVSITPKWYPLGCFTVTSKIGSLSALITCNKQLMYFCINTLPIIYIWIIIDMYSMYVQQYSRIKKCFQSINQLIDWSINQLID